MADRTESAWHRQVSPTQWKAFLTTFAAWTLDAFDFTILTFVLIDIQDSFSVNRALAGLLGTVTLLFRVVGGIGGAGVAQVPEPVGIAVRLRWVRHAGAVVHGRADAVAVGIVAGIARARIAGVADAVGVAVLLAGIRDRGAVVHVPADAVGVGIV